MLKALQEKLLNQELFDECCQEFTREMNRLRMERRASLSSARREVERIGARIKKLLNLLVDDEIAVDERKAEIASSRERHRFSTTASPKWQMMSWTCAYIRASISAERT